MLPVVGEEKELPIKVRGRDGRREGGGSRRKKRRVCPMDLFNSIFMLDDKNRRKENLIETMIKNDILIFLSPGSALPHSSLLSGV